MLPEIIQFDDFDLDLVRYELRRGDRVIKLEKNPMELLILLAENPGRLVTREQIIQRLWGDDVFVDTRHGINTAIHKLRNALGEDSERPRILETVVGKGYRLVAKLAATTNHNSLADAGLSPPIVPVKEESSNELPVIDPRKLPKAKWTWIGLVIIVLVFLWVGIWWIFRTSADTNSAAIQLIPLAGVPQGHQAEASFSPDGNQLAFSQSYQKQPGIYTTLVDGEKSFRLTDNPGDCCPAWSPDGQQIAFSRYSEREIALYVISAFGGAEHQLHQAANFSWNAPGYVAWSPDGKFLAFSDRQENGGHASIALLSIADGTTRRLTTPPDQAYDYGPAFSPNGSQVAFIRRNGAGVASDVYLVPSSGGEASRLTFDNAQTDGVPAWGEDGREIFFSSLRGGLSTLWRVSVAGGRPSSIAGVGAISCCPSISRKGNRIVFQSSFANYSIWLADLKDKTQAENLVSTKGRNWRPDFSPDGSKIAFESDRSGYAEIWTCDSNGSNCGQLTSLRGVAGTARWSPDGSQIAFEFTGAEHSEIYVVDAAGGRPRLLPTLPGADNVAPSWSRDGKWIYFTSDYKSGLFDLWKVPLPNGSPVRVTNNGGVYGVESVDGHFLYYAKLEAPGVWRKSLNGGEETRILDKAGGIFWYDWALARNGIYFADIGARPKEAIEFLDFEARKTKPVVYPDKPVRWGVALSPDGRHFLYVQTDLVQSSLVLVKNFR